MTRTPKERAERELRHFWKPDASEEKDGRRLLAIFAGAIRDAENEALERAREVAYANFEYEVADEILALKHAETIL